MIALDVFYKNRPVFWNNFLNAHDRNYYDLDLREDVLTNALSLYGAFTNWQNDDDPIWFPDEESLAQFILAWS